jgi:hypothetical protein
MKKKDALLILGIAVFALVLLLAGRPQRSAPASSPAVPAEETAAPAAEKVGSDPAEAAVAQFFEEFPAEAYLLMTTGKGTYAPIPLNEENAFSVTQEDGSVNVVHVGKNSFYMESSNCENQNCVQQGEVTLDNREERILFNMIICLPHNLRLELLTPEEARETLLQMYASVVEAPAPEGGD